MNAPLVCGLLLAALTLRAAEPPPLADWMAALPDDTPLKSLAIPGAHNAATAGMPWFAACQDLPVPQLLEAGTRYLDLRVRLDGDGHPAFFHGPATGGRLEDLLRACAAFLAAHPRETLLLDFHHFRDGAEAAADARLRAILGNRLLHAPPHAPPPASSMASPSAKRAASAWSSGAPRTRAAISRATTTRAATPTAPSIPSTSPLGTPTPPNVSSVATSPQSWPDRPTSPA